MPNEIGEVADFEPGILQRPAKRCRGQIWI
jgi:hypothetical protein